MHGQDNYIQYLRMPPQTIDDLLRKVGPRRAYWSATPDCPEISPAERLVFTLRYFKKLSTGNSQMSMSFDFRIGRSTVCGTIKETCETIWQCLQPEFVQPPATDEEWLRVSQQFQKLWNFSKLWMGNTLFFRLQRILDLYSIITKATTPLVC